MLKGIQQSVIWHLYLQIVLVSLELDGCLYRAIFFNLFINRPNETIKTRYF